MAGQPQKQTDGARVTPLWKSHTKFGIIYAMSDNQTNQNAVSVYGQEGLDDFPVLKAFQQYVDAEQSKARKRMIVLCVFFGFLMTVVITFFLFALMDLSGKNQELNDRLVEYAMKHNDRQNVIVQSPAPAPSNDIALKAVAESIASIQKQIAENQARQLANEQKTKELEAERERRFAAERAAAAANAGPTKEQLEQQKRIDADTKKLARATALLKVEKDRLAAEKERLRQQEIDLHRRRMYPEYYEKQEQKPQVAPVQQPAAQPKPVKYFDTYMEDNTAMPEPSADDNDDDIDELIDNLPTPTPIEPVKVVTNAKKPSARTTPAAPAEKTTKADVDTPDPTPNPTRIKRSSQRADHFNVPLEINGEAADWLIPTA